MDYQRMQPWLHNKNDFTIGLASLGLFILGVVIQLAGYLTGMVPTLAICAFGLVAAAALVWSFIGAQHLRRPTGKHLLALFTLMIAISIYGGNA